MGDPAIRPSGIVVRTLAFDAYAYNLLRDMAPNSKAYGHLLSSLIFAEHARRQERLQCIKDPATINEEESL